MIYHLHRWGVIGEDYKAPELRMIRLVGFRNQEEKRISTSYVDHVDGRVITTISGSVYILDDIDPEYLEWLIGNKIEYDPDHPIKYKS
jgi:hypothetical protein